MQRKTTYAVLTEHFIHLNTEYILFFFAGRIHVFTHSIPFLSREQREASAALRNGAKYHTNITRLSVCLSFWIQPLDVLHVSLSMKHQFPNYPHDDGVNVFANPALVGAPSPLCYATYAYSSAVFWVRSRYCLSMRASMHFFIILMLGANRARL